MPLKYKIYEIYIVTGNLWIDSIWISKAYLWGQNGNWWVIFYKHNKNNLQMHQIWTGGKKCTTQWNALYVEYLDILWSEFWFQTAIVPYGVKISPLSGTECKRLREFFQHFYPKCRIIWVSPLFWRTFKPTTKIIFLPSNQLCKVILQQNG